MSDTNVPLNELLTTEGMDFSRRGTPLAPFRPEHYTNKAYVDEVVSDVNVRSPAVVTVTCNGTASRSDGNEQRPARHRHSRCRRRRQRGSRSLGNVMMFVWPS